MNHLYPTLLCACLGCVGCYDQGIEDFDMFYQQTSCFGPCPSFSIYVHSDGSLLYAGKNTVFAKVTNQQIYALVEAFEQCDFFSLNDHHVGLGATDFAGAVTSIRFRGRYKSVILYFGDPLAPEGLKHLYSRINDIENTQQWVGHPVINDFYPSEEAESENPKTQKSPIVVEAIYEDF